MCISHCVVHVEDHELEYLKSYRTADAKDVRERTKWLCYAHFFSFVGVLLRCDYFIPQTQRDVDPFTLSSSAYI